VFAEPTNVCIEWSAATCATNYDYLRWTGLGATGTNDGAYSTSNTYYSDTFSTAYSHFGDDGSLSVRGYNGAVYGERSCIDFYLLPIPIISEPSELESYYPTDDMTFSWNGGVTSFSPTYDLRINDTFNGGGSEVFNDTTTNTTYPFGTGADFYGLFPYNQLSFRMRSTYNSVTTDWTPWVNFSVY
jgi:hypothetical protein